MEEYLHKRIWLQFTKDFKEKHCIVDDNLDPFMFTTPVVNKSKKDRNDDLKIVDSAAERPNKEKCDKTKAFDNLNDEKNAGRETRLADSNQKDEINKSSDKSNKDTVNVSLRSTVSSDVVSPMTSLAQNFEKLNILDDTWSEKATFASSDKAELSVLDSEHMKGGPYDSKKPDDIVESENINSKNTGDVEENSDLNENLSHANAVIELKKPDNSTGVDCNNKEQKDNVTKEELTSSLKTIQENKQLIDGDIEARQHNCDDKQKGEKVKTKYEESTEFDDPPYDKYSRVKYSAKFEYLRSISSGSTGSFETAIEGSDTSSLSFCSQDSESGQLVCVRIQDSDVYKELEQKICDSVIDSISTRVHCILQWKPYSCTTGKKVTIVLLPSVESASRMWLLENVDVASCDGDITKISEGEKIEIGSSKTEVGAGIQAYLTRAETLPKCGYIHGYVMKFLSYFFILI